MERSRREDLPVPHLLMGQTRSQKILRISYRHRVKAKSISKDVAKMQPRCLAV